MSMSTTSARDSRDDLHGLVAVGGLAHDHQVGGGVDEQLEPGADEGLVVDEHHPDGHGCS
jgi:hypothetical protein